MNGNNNYKKRINPTERVGYKMQKLVEEVQDKIQKKLGFEVKKVDVYNDLAHYLKLNFNVEQIIPKLITLYLIKY